MNASHRDFFKKLLILCNEYGAIIEDSGSIRKGTQVIFPDAVFEKFEAYPNSVKVVDENGFVEVMVFKKI